MAKIKKRIRLTREQAEKFNRRLDTVIEKGHTNDLHCDCELCRALAEQAKLMEHKRKI